MNKILTPTFRVSFPCVFEPRAIEDGQKKKYSLTMLFTLKDIQSDPQQKKLWDAMLQSVKDCAREKWGDKIPKGLKSPFRDGKEKEEYQGYGDGVVFVIATTMTRPGLVDSKLQRIIDPEQFYGGCYARASINPYPWTFMGKSGVSFGLQNIQMIKDGEPFGGRTRAEDDFNALEDLTQEASETNATELFG